MDSSLTGHSPTDAPIPPQMAHRAERIGVQKTCMDTWSLLVLALLAGAFIGFEAIFATIVTAGSDGVLPRYVRAHRLGMSTIGR
jgi:formate transporter